MKAKKKKLEQVSVFSPVKKQTNPRVRSITTHIQNGKMYLKNSEGRVCLSLVSDSSETIEVIIISTVATTM